MSNIRHVNATTGRLPHDPLNEPASGVVGAALSLAREQAMEGHAVELWGWNHERSGRTETAEGVSIWTSDIWPWARFGRWDLRWLMPVWKQAVLAQPVDVLHVHVDPNLLLLPKARVRVLHLQTPVPDPFPRAYQRLLGRADAVVCCSSFVRQSLLERADIDPGRTFVVHNGASPVTLNEGDRQRIRTQLDLVEQDVVLLYAGAIVPEKGLAHLVKALDRINGQCPRLKLLIAGGSRLWGTPDTIGAADSYEAQVRDSAVSLKPHIRFLGLVPRTQMPALYTAADMVCVPSVWPDPHPTVVCEAMAAGRPVIGSAVGGITETIKHGKSGYLVPPGDEEALAAAITKLCANKDLRRKLGQTGQKSAQVAFSWQISARRLGMIYAALLERNEDLRNLQMSARTKEES
jgi:glycosyltransferase involved in cell wall biosynthesis